MSHEITELADGVHTFVSVRKDAWHRLGIVVDEPMSALDAMKLAKLTDWDVRKQPVFTADENGQPMQLSDKFATVFTNPVTRKTQELGVVGKVYEPIQNEENADLFDALTDEGGAKIETVGSLNDGRRTFVCMKLPESMQIGGIDRVDTYIVGLNSHDGSSSFRFIVTPVRVECSNTVAAAIRQAESSFSIRHTVSARGRIAEAREALGLTFKFTEAFEAEAQAMIEQTVTDAKFDAIMKDLFGDPEKQSSKRANTSTTAHLDATRALWNESATLQNIKGTAWAGYNVVTEYLDHFINLRTGKTDVETQRAQRALFGNPVVKMKQRAFAAFATV